MPTRVKCGDQYGYTHRVTRDYGGPHKHAPLDIRVGVRGDAHIARDRP